MYHNQFFTESEIGSVILSPRDIQITDPLVAHSKDLLGVVHTLRYDTSSGEFRLYHYGESTYTVALSITDGTVVEKIDFTYNQNNNIHICYEVAGSIYQSYQFGSTTFHGITCYGTFPMCQLDSRDAVLSSLNDVVLVYFGPTTLEFRLQREDFEIAHTIPTTYDLDRVKILNFGVNNKNRLEIYFQTNYVE